MDLSRPAPAALDAPPQVEQPLAQLRYALWLDRGTRLGLLVLVSTLGLYLMGWLPSRVPVHELPTLWHLPVDQFRQLTGAPLGWGWLALLQHGDMAALTGIALLAGCSIPCLLVLVPLYARAGDRVFVAICLAQVAVLLFAASGVLNTGH